VYLIKSNVSGVDYMRLNVNLAALNIYREHVKTAKGQSVAIDRISSGSKANRAADDPNAIAQSERMRIQIRGLQMANRNAQDGVSMLQTAEGGLDNVTSILHRIKELSVQAGGATSTDDKAVIQNEINELVSGIDDIVKNTEFNGVKLLGDEKVTDNSKPNMLDMATGANVDERISIPIHNLTSNYIGDVSKEKYLKFIDVTNDGGVDEALSIVGGALDTVFSVRSKYGALQNRFESTIQITSAVETTIQKAESDMRDADIAEEMMSYTKYNLLMEAGNAMMVQANKFPQDILRILENVK
jgi:flagellin